jgi:hypothetical protein
MTPAAPVSRAVTLLSLFGMTALGLFVWSVLKPWLTAKAPAKVEWKAAIGLVGCIFGGAPVAAFAAFNQPNVSGIPIGWMYPLGLILGVGFTRLPSCQKRLTEHARDSRSSIFSYALIWLEFVGIVLYTIFLISLILFLSSPSAGANPSEAEIQARNVTSVYGELAGFTLNNPTRRQTLLIGLLSLPVLGFQIFLLLTTARSLKGSRFLRRLADATAAVLALRVVTISEALLIHLFAIEALGPMKGMYSADVVSSEIIRSAEGTVQTILDVDRYGTSMTMFISFFSTFVIFLAQQYLAVYPTTGISKHLYIAAIMTFAVAAIFTVLTVLPGGDYLNVPLEWVDDISSGLVVGMLGATFLFNRQIAASSNRILVYATSVAFAAFAVLQLFYWLLHLVTIYHVLLLLTGFAANVLACILASALFVDRYPPADLTVAGDRI